MARIHAGKLGVSSQPWAAWWCCHPEQLWCPVVPETLATCIIAMVPMTLVMLVHGLSLSSPITVWHCSLSCRAMSPEDGSQLQRQIWWAGNGNKLSRQDAPPTGLLILWTRYPRNFKVSSNISILFWYHHHDRFKWVSHLHMLRVYMYTQIGWWIIWETLPRLFKLCLLFLHEK